MRRRSFFKQASGLTAAVLLAGCSTSNESENSPSAGTLIVENNHTIPHIVTIRIQDGPQDQLGNPITPHSQVAIEPNEEKSYPDWLKRGPSEIKPGEYIVEIKLDGQQTKDFQFNPRPKNGEPMFVSVEVTDTGELLWGVTANNN
jgi:hypothetical protein